MQELDRLKTRKRRRQEAFQALNEAEDRIKILQSTLADIGVRVQELQNWRSFLRPWLRAQALAVIAGHLEKAPLLAEIATRVQGLRGEFSALAHSDQRELEELQALNQTLNTTHTR